MLGLGLCPKLHHPRVERGYSLKFFQRQQLQASTDRPFWNWGLRGSQGFSHNQCSLGSVLRSEGSIHSLLQGPDSPSLLFVFSAPHSPSGLGLLFTPCQTSLIVGPR